MPLLMMYLLGLAAFSVLLAPAMGLAFAPVALLWPLTLPAGILLGICLMVWESITGKSLVQIIMHREYQKDMRGYSFQVS